jgi:hypothetical protein
MAKNLGTGTRNESLHAACKSLVFESPASVPVLVLRGPEWISVPTGC